MAGVISTEERKSSTCERIVFSPGIHGGNPASVFNQSIRNEAGLKPPMPDGAASRANGLRLQDHLFDICRHPVHNETHAGRYQAIRPYCDSYQR